MIPRPVVATNSEAGFTLLELLIAVTLLGFLSVLLFAGLHTGRRAWETVERTSESANRVRLFQETLRQELERAYPLMGRDPMHPHIAFKGEPHRLFFLAQNIAGLPDGEMGYVTVTLDESGKGTRIVSAISPELSQKQDQAPRLTRFDNITSLAFSYYGSLKSGDESKWHEVWDSPSRMPELVRLRASETTANSVWPDVIVKPRIDADMACNFDLITRFCQGR